MMLVKMRSTLIDSIIARAVALGLVYWLTVVLAIELVSPVDKIALFWPPNAIAVAALIFSSRKNWPPYLIAMAIAYFAARVPAGHLPLYVYFGFCAANIAEVLIVAEMVKRLVRAPITHETLTKVLTVATLTSVPASIVSALIGGIFVAWGVEKATFVNASVGWFTGDLSGLLLVLPVLLTWLTPGASPLKSYTKGEIIERTVIASIYVVIGLLAPVYLVEESQIILIFPYLVFPVLIWTAIRMGLRSATAATLVVGLFAIVLTYQGQGPFNIGNLSAFNQVVLMKVGLITITLTTIFLATVVADRRQGEKALRDNKELFLDISEAATDRFWEMDETLRFTSMFDHPGLEVFPPTDTFIGSTRWEMAGVDPDKDEKWGRHREDLLAHRPFRDFEFAIKDEDGVSHYRNISGKPFFDEEGNFLGYRGSVTDITERKKAEKARERLSQAVETVPVGIALFDSDDRLVFFNSRYGELMEVMADILKPGVTFEEVIRTIVDRQPVKDARGREEEFIQERIKHHRNPTGSFNIRRENMWLVADETRLPDGSIFTIISDITERKQAEEALRDSEAHLRNILDHSPTPIYFKDTKGRFLLANSQYEKNYGVKFEDIKGKTSLEIFPGEHGKQFYDHDMAVLKGQETIVREELIDGKTYVTSKFPILADDGTLIGLGGVETDITDRKKTEEILRRSQKMEAVGQLTGGVAHDFNNLLAVISGNLELAAEARGLEDKTREMLDRAMAAVAKGAKLTDQLLTFSRQQTLAPKTIEANTQLFDTINLLMQTLGEDIDIKTAFDAHIPLIKVDPGILGNAILNIAINARDAMPRGGTLTIKTTSVDLDGDSVYDNQIPLSGPYVLISVSDTGTGIKKKDLDRVFEPFFTTKGVGEGTGMGLSMVYGFVKQSGGHVTIESKRGKGTTINLYFPAAESLDAEKKEKSATRPMAEAKGTETILVVEDDEGVRQTILEMLSSLGYVVMEAEDGPSALKVLGKDSDSIDLVLSDVIMPSGMSGLDLANELRRHYKEIKVLVTSGYPEKVIDKDGIDSSGITLLRKPFMMADLAEAVRGALDR